MKQSFIFHHASLALLLLFSLSLFGQSKDVQKEELVKAQKIAFFTEKLNLSSDEAQLFWPVYNEYWQKKNKIIDDRRNAMKFCSENLEKLSDKEIERYGDMYINFHKQESDLLVEFNEKFKKVLTPEKVIKLYFADYEFKTYLLQQIRNAPKKE
jgi:hypothetical protein